MSYQTKFPLILVILSLSLWISACSPEVTVIDQREEVQPNPILDSSKEWRSPRWLTAEQIYIVTRGSTSIDVQLSAYNLRTDEWQVMEFSEIDCPIGSLERSHPLPDRRIGFVYECRDSSSGVPTHYLIAWEPSSDEFEIVKQHPQWALGDIFHPGDFSVSPDYATIIYDENPGALYSKLYKVSLIDDSIEIIAKDFYRAEYPDWSIDGQRIAFAGNTDGPGWNKSSDIFSGLPNLRNIAYTPWNIYTMGVDGENTQEVLSGITSLQFLKWNPSGQNQLAFSGVYNGRSGLWVYDLDVKQLHLLWSNNTGNVFYDWSPDGSQMILMDCLKQDGDEIGKYMCTPTIITLPD